MRDRFPTAVCRSFALAKLINVGSKIYPKWRCRGCHAPFRLLSRAADSRGPAAQEELRTQRREHFADFQSQLAAVRLVHPDDAGAQVPDGCNVNLVGAPASHQEKRKAVAELFELHYARKELQTNERVYWLTERQYKSYQKMFENCTPQEADQKFADDVANTRIRRKYNAAGELMLAVRTAPFDAFVKVSGQSHEAKKNMEQEFGVSDLEAMRKLLRTCLEAPPDQQQEATLGCETAWEPQAASMGMPPAVVSAAARKGAKPTSDVVSGLLSSTKASDRGSSAASVGDGSSCASSASTPKVSSKQVEMGLLTVDNMKNMGLVKARQYVLAQGRKLAREEHQIKKSAFRRLQELVEKLGDAHTEVVALDVKTTMSQFDVLVKSIQEAVSSAPSWTMHDFSEKGFQAVKTFKDALALVPVMEEKLTTLSAVRTLEVRKAASDRRKLSLRCRTVTLQLLDQGLWANAATWWGKNVFGISTMTGEATCVTTINAKHQGTRPEQQITLFKADSPRCPALEAFDARMAFLKPKVDAALPKLQAHMEKNGMDRTMTLLKPKSEDVPVQEAKTWTPKNFELFKDTLGHWSGKHSGAWVLYDKVGVFRMGLQDLAFDTLAGTWKVVKGSVLVFLWTVHDLVKRNGDEMLDMEGFMEAMTVTEASAWLSKNSSWVKVDEGQSLWKPACLAMLTVAMEPETLTVWQPYHSRVVLSKHELGKSVIRDLHTFYDDVSGEPFEALAAAWKAATSVDAASRNGPVQ